MAIDEDHISEMPASSVAVNSASAPFIYCDGVAAMGSMLGEVQIELVASTVVLTGDGGMRNEGVIVAHLRCCQAAARILRDAIDKALALAQRAADGARLAAAVEAGPVAGTKFSQH